MKPAETCCVERHRGCDAGVASHDGPQVADLSPQTEQGIGHDLQQQRHRPVSEIGSPPKSDHAQRDGHDRRSDQDHHEHRWDVQIHDLGRVRSNMSSVSGQSCYKGYEILLVQPPSIAVLDLTHISNPYRRGETAFKLQHAPSIRALSILRARFTY